MNLLYKINHSLRLINYKLFVTLLLIGFIPTIYTTIRIFLLGQLPTSNGLNIASQIFWIHLIYEVIQETIILPLFFILGQVYSSKKELINRITTGLIITFFVNTTVSIFLIIFTEQIVFTMAQNVSLIDATIFFVRIEAIANIFITLAKFMLVVFIMLNQSRNLYIILILQMSLTILFDIFLISELQISLNLGANGVAISNLLTNLIVFIIAIILLKRENLNLFKKYSFDFRWIKSTKNICSLSGIETLVRNVIFMLVVLRMVNEVGEQGTFWVANSFLWGWLLLPIIQLSELIKRDTAKTKQLVSKKTLGYFALTTIIITTWLLLIPFIEPFFKNILLLQNAEQVFAVVIISIPFYILFAYNSIIDGIFYGLGRTDLMLYQSLAVNIFYYGSIFALYLLEIYQPTLMSITLIFAIGLAIDSILTFIIFFIQKKSQKNFI